MRGCRAARPGLSQHPAPRGRKPALRAAAVRALHCSLSMLVQSALLILVLLQGAGGAMYKDGGERRECGLPAAHQDRK